MKKELEPSLLPEENCRAAAYYGVGVIQDYINDIRAAASPRTPEECGGPVYEYFLLHLKNLERILNGETLQDVINDMKKDEESGTEEKYSNERSNKKSMQVAGRRSRKWYNFLWEKGY